MKPVDEDEYGAYLGVTADFRREFSLIENNPNFEVYDAKDRQRRFIVSKASRIPDDEDITAGRYGIDFNRARPTPQEAVDYHAALPGGYQWLGDIAFAAADENEYAKKAAARDSFYSYVWGAAAQTVWAAPHSGSVDRPPDDTLPFPKLWIDNHTAGVAARCAYRDGGRGKQRVMIYVHATGLLGAAVNLGDFGVADGEKMAVAAARAEIKYHDKVQVLAEGFKQDFRLKTGKLLEHIYRRRGTLDPAALGGVSKDDSFNVTQQAKVLKLYGREIAEFTPEAFSEALDGLGDILVPVVNNNVLYPARHVGELLGLKQKISEGLMHGALSVECAKYYAANAPELIADIILDIKRELFPSS
ncbi:MAG: hypothetical protein WC370_03765 [Dehalococcoidales bacterium]|jgi:hypothetical protein